MVLGVQILHRLLDDVDVVEMELLGPGAYGATQRGWQAVRLGGRFSQLVVSLSAVCLVCLALTCRRVGALVHGGRQSGN